MKPLLLTALILACAPGQADRDRPAPESAAMTSESPAPGEVLATRDKPVTLGERTTVEIEMPAASLESMGGGERLGLYIEGLDLGKTGAYFDVYANSQPVGTLSSFGPAGAKVGYDITGLVRKLEAEGKWKGGLELTFVRRGLEPPKGQPRMETAPEGPPACFQRIRILREQPLESSDHL
ncbi:MAG TPA: hypothetical protein VF789_15500 [Thermoanaerobaculia bacterium]